MKTSASSHHSAPATLAATALAVVLVVVLGCAALYQATMGFALVSTEDGRRRDIAESPRAMPSATLDWPSRPLLGDALRGDGRVTIVAFIYTTCNAVCSVLGTEFQQLQHTIRARGLQHKVRLLSISFDARDKPGQLDAYAARLHADAAIWRFAGIAAPAQRRAVLDTFGVVVLPAPDGEFVHNAAFHIVGADGRLALIDDFDNPDLALADAVAMHDAVVQHNPEPR